MSISITPTSIALSSIDRTLRTASTHFDANCPQSSVDTRFVRSLFVARSGSESGQVDRQVCRLLLEGLIAESTQLSACFSQSAFSSLTASTGCAPSASTPIASGTTQTRSSFASVAPQLPSPSAASPAASSTSSAATSSPTSSGRVNSNRLKLKGDFCACVLKQLVVNCVSDPSRASIRRFYSFIDALEERVCELRVGQHGHFLDGLLCKELSLSLVPQCLVELVLLASCIVPHVSKALSQHVKVLFESLLEAANKPEKSAVFGCTISVEFVHQLFASLTSSQIADLLVSDRQTTADFLKLLEKGSLLGLVSRGSSLPSTLAPLHVLLKIASESSKSGGVPPSNSEHLSAADFVDIEDKDLESVMEGLANQNPNLLAQQIQELGATFTSSVQACKQHLAALNAADVHSLNSVSLSRVIIMMINTCTPSSTPSAGMQHIQQTTASWDHRAGSAPALGSGSSTDGVTTASGVLQEGAPTVSAGAPVSWNAKVFATAVNEISSNLNWSEVVMHLDQPNFFIRNKTQLQFLTTLLLEGLGSNPFPIALLYREWNFHKIGQFSWIEQILQNPDVFCFTDYPHRAVNLSALKVQPEETNRDLTNWRSLDLIDILLRLSEVRKLLNSVMNVLHKPISTCADVLLLGLLQIPAPVSGMRSHLFQVLIPMLIGNHPNAIAVLNMAWNNEELNKPPFQIRSVILTALCNYYMKNPDDQSKLTRILEVAHELKPNGLGELFNLSQFPFTIDLACLASRRDFLKLDKWIEDKLAEHGDAFATHLISYIRRRLPLGVVTASQGGALPQETLQTLLNCLSKPTSVSSVTMGELQQLFHQMRHLQIKNGDARTAGVNLGSRAQVGLPQTSAGSVFGGAPTSMQQQAGGTFSNFPFGGSAFGTSSRDQVLAAAAQQLQNRQQQQQAGGLPASMQMFSGSAPTGAAPGSAAAAFAQQTDLLKTWSAASSGLQPSFGGGNALSMSPSGQMMRTGFLGANGSATASRSAGAIGGSGWNMPAGLPGTGALRSTPGPTTPSSSIDFRAQLPPGAPGGAAGMLGGTGGFGAAGGAVQAQPSAAAGRLTAAMADDLTTIQFNEEIQNEANMYFQQIYSQHSQMSVNEFVARLKTFKNSPNQKDRDVLACVVKNLFEEYRFFHEYPERELRTTAEVYGGIIREGIISNLQFATAVRKVIESLQAEPGSMLWTFGIVSLNACRVQGQLPQGHGRETPNWQQQPQRTSSNASESTRAIQSRTGTSVLSVTSVDTLVNATEREGSQIKQPPDSTIEKVSFLFNNLSQSNLPKKTEEMKAMMNEMGEDFVHWLAQYMVMKRVSIEQNFQPLYNNFLMSIGDRQLENFVKQETFRNIKILLRSDKRQAASNFGDRQLLKNLGLWLGAITIARDRPIVTADLDMKSLLMEAYYKGQQELLFVVPFIAKIIVSCSKSAIFGANCAWIRAILRILAELHNEPDLKLNLKFEIEVLCKELNVDLRSLNVEGVLKDTERLLRVPQQLSDLKMLKQPDMQASGISCVGTSPVPGVRLGPDGTIETGSGTPSRQISTPVSEVEGAGGTPQPGVSVAANQGQGVTQVQPSAHFHYHDINVVSFDGLVPHLKMSASLPLFQMNPQLKHVVRPAISHAIKELIGPVTERAIKIAMHVTEHICKKDFALDPDEQGLRRATHHMIRAMTAGMAAITCRDPLSTTLQGYLKQAFINSFHGVSISPEQQKLIDEASMTIAEDNVELATNFIVKSACEKATPEMDKRMEGEFVMRKQARQDGRQYADPVALARAQQMPEKIRPRVGQVTAQQMAIYDEFSSKICGFKPTTAEDMIVDYSVMKSSTPTTMQSMVHQAGIHEKEVEQFTSSLQLLARDIDMVLNAHGIGHYKAATAIAAIRDGISQLAANPRDPIQLHNLIQRLAEQMLYAYRSGDTIPLAQQHSNMQMQMEVEWSRRLKDVFISVCRILLTQFSLPDLARRITRLIVDCRLDYRFNVDAIDLMAKHMLIQMSVYDQHLALLIDGGSNFEATLFAQRLVKLNIGSGSSARQQVLEGLPLTLEQLSKIQQFGQNRPTPTMESFPSAMSNAMPHSESPVTGLPRSGSAIAPPQANLADRAHAGNLAALGSGAVHPAGTGTGTTGGRGDDAQETHIPELQSKVEMILREWIQLCYTPMAQKEPQQALATIVHVMHEQGVLATDEMITRFFRLCTEMCVDVSYRLLKNESHVHQSTVVRQRCYYTLDAFVKLTCLMVKHSDGGQYQTKINLLKKVLNIVTNVLHMDHEVRGIEFHAMPYHRILIIMFNELTVPDPVLDAIAWNILEAFGQALFILQPRRVPGFAFAWLDIVGHRNFIARLLKDSAEPLKTAAMYTQLIICHLKFLSPFLRNIQLPKSIATIYKGTLRVLLVILHDFPELLCEYHYVICDTIPPNCVQLRNLILSAYPKNMRLPDPFGSNLKVDSLVEMTQEPKMHVNMATIIPVDLRTRLDDYLATRSSVDFHASLPTMLQVSNIPGSKYNTTVMNAVVLYVGMRAIQAIQEKQQCITMSTIAHTAYMDIFQNLAVSLCTEGRYLFFNAIANQLRYPNSHTHYFSCTLLYLFLEANTEVIQEQITRILFERLVALRPHPWGLLITFIELIKNPNYGFWKHEFVRCAPEIERLFQSVANSCIGSNNARHANVAAPHAAQPGGAGSARNSPAPSAVGNI
ncbi:unnamed protein product [Toxocara canis]|uniref:CCR4-NOT transcription complex subunit 1 n=1 Tax=Toxocara canis TaxID=6265 RepID=A0A183UCZ2_TOXCA|nr:unnamed protein product [Toxocara canis]